MQAALLERAVTRVVDQRRVPNQEVAKSVESNFCVRRTASRTSRATRNRFARWSITAGMNDAKFRTGSRSLI